MPENRIAGSAFEKAGLDALGVDKNTTTFYVNGTATIPDAVTSSSVIEIKGGRQISLTRQIRAQIQLARNTGRQFVLLVDPDVQRISAPLLQEIRASGGKVKTFWDDVSGTTHIVDFNRYTY